MGPMIYPIERAVEKYTTNIRERRGEYKSKLGSVKERQFQFTDMRTTDDPH